MTSDPMASSILYVLCSTLQDCTGGGGSPACRPLPMSCCRACVNRAHVGHLGPGPQIRAHWSSPGWSHSCPNPRQGLAGPCPLSLSHRWQLTGTLPEHRAAHELEEALGVEAGPVHGHGVLGEQGGVRSHARARAPALASSLQHTLWTLLPRLPIPKTLRKVSLFRPGFYGNPEHWCERY